MRIIDILDQAEIKEFESPPLFSYQQRKVFFEIPTWLKSKLQGLTSPTNDVGIVLQLGYFKACGRFFRISSFQENDLIYICRVGGNYSKVQFSHRVEYIILAMQ